MILCSLRGTNLTNIGDQSSVMTPFAVSIVSSSCRRPRNLVRVVHPHLGSGTQSGNAEYAVNFSVCAAPIFGNFDDVSDLVEFVEVNRVLGAQKFQFYLESVGPRVAPCLREYARRGIVDIQPWTPPSDIAHIIHYHGQILAINECLYRMMYRTKYLVIQDLDEFVVPMRSGSWLSMLNSINEDTRTDSDRIASYNFRNRFFQMEFPKSSTFTSNNDTERRFKTLGVLWAGRKLYPFNQRSKVMARPERIIIWHVHLILDSSLVRSGDVNTGVDTKHGQLFHYRRGFTVANATTVSRMSVFKPSILRRTNVATAAICLSGDYLYI